MEKLQYFLLLCFGFLSVYNFLRDMEVKNRFDEMETRQLLGRNRRDVEVNSDTFEQNIFNIQKLTEFVQEQSNKTFQREINQALTKLISNFPVKKLCKNVLVQCKNDQCQEEKKVVHEGSNAKGSKPRCIQGLQGPPGSAGPTGPKGERGLGLEPPKLVNDSFIDRTVNLSDSTIFTCVFFGNPIPQVSWKSSARQFQVESSIDKERSEITSRLIISNITWGDRGAVSCHATSILGQSSGKGQLNVLSLPVIQVNESLIFAPQGINFQFPLCRVRSSPQAKVTWKRVLWPLPAKRSNVDGNSLNISNLQFDDEGFYICEAQNFLGHAKHKFQLKVNSLKMHQSPASKILAAGKQVLVCSAFGNVDEMSGEFVSSTGTSLEWSTYRNGNLFKIETTVTESATYICKIKNLKEQVQAFSVVNFFSLESKFLRNTSHVNLLGEWLKGIDKIGEYKLCWSSQSDQSGFNRGCGGKKDTITIVRDAYSSDKIVGGFTDMAWKSSSYNRWSRSANSTQTFLFNFSDGGATKYPAPNGGKNAVCTSNAYGPCFGNQDLYFRCCSLLIQMSSKSPLYGSMPNGRMVYVEVFYKV